MLWEGTENLREQATSTEENTVPTKNQGSRIERIVSQHFTILLIVLALCGGVTAMLLPWALQISGSTGQVDSNLRLHILYVTGGVIAVLGLVETHRKNTIDREKAGVEKENYEKIQAHQASVLEEQQRQFDATMNRERAKIEADREKNNQDHRRQVLAERRSRYTTAIEQLSNDKASIRLGGVYTLVGLVDEWLADEKTIPNIEERRKEGQVIINNLCAYIRSPFLLAERAEQLDEPYAKDLQEDFAGDKDKFDADKRAFAQEKAALEEERQVRLSIIQEIRERLSNKIESGSWSDFDYDFSNTVFFYLTDFSNSLFDASSNFTQATFTEDTHFSETTFTKGADFTGAKFTQNADFSETTFTKDAHFSGVVFTGYASFSGAKFTQNADFSKATFTKDAHFSEAEFTGYASFSETTFTKDARFSGAEFTEVNFSWAEFTQNADFSGAKFTQNADFSAANFEDKPIFEYALDSKTYKARFSHNTEPEDYKFEVSHNSPCKIETEEQNYNGIKFIIPKGTELFDPGEPSKSEQDVPYI